jgi:general secretion pathway protein G
VRPSLTFWLAILGIIALLYAIWPRIGSGHEHARPTAVLVDINGGIKSALDEYKMDTGHYPGSLQDLVQKNSDATNWHGPYFDPPRLPIDPWGEVYVYTYPGRHNTNAYDLVSAGPDGRLGTEDDIGNWTK